jgi:hypothetical protein
MRCARCDRPVVPQAVGRTPDGNLVFGWCLPCLEETACREIDVAQPGRRLQTKLDLRGRRRTAPRAASRAHRPRTHPPVRPRLLEARSRAILAVAGLLGAWGVVLLAAGLTLARLRDPDQPRAPGNVPPALLVAGGASAALIGFTLWASLIGRPWLRSSLLGKLGALAAVLVVVALSARVVTRRGPRLPLAFAVTAAIAVSLAALLWLPRCRPVRTKGPSL